MHPFYLEKLYQSRYEDWLRQAKVERLIRAANRNKPKRAWTLSLGQDGLRESTLHVQGLFQR